MDKAYFVDLYAYNRWANHKLWESVIQLTDAQYHQDIPYSIGSVHNHCLHMASVEGWWFHFLSEGDLAWLENFAAVRDDFRERTVLRSEWDKIESFMQLYLSTLTPEELTRKVKPPFWEDEEEDLAPVMVRGALIQVANHSTDHRAQVLRTLHDFGVETFEQDYLQYHWAKDE